jgi:predicted kinase
MVKMFLVCGISGVGKTTLSYRMAEKHNLLRIGVDDFYAKVNGDERDRSNKFEVWIEFFQAIHAAEKAGMDCVVEISGLTRNQRMEFIDWFPTFEHHLIFIEAAAELRNMNNKSRARTVPEWRIAEMESRVQLPNLDTDDCFDTIAFITNKDNVFAKPQMIKGHWPCEEVNYNG